MSVRQEVFLTVLEQMGALKATSAKFLVSGSHVLTKTLVTSSAGIDKPGKILLGSSLHPVSYSILLIQFY